MLFINSVVYDFGLKRNGWEPCPIELKDPIANFFGLDGNYSILKFIQGSRNILNLKSSFFIWLQFNNSLFSDELLWISVIEIKNNFLIDRIF